MDLKQYVGYPGQKFVKVGGSGAVAMFLAVQTVLILRQRLPALAELFPDTVVVGAFVTFYTGTLATLINWWKHRKDGEKALQILIDDLKKEINHLATDLDRMERTSMPTRLKRPPDAGFIDDNQKPQPAKPMVYGEGSGA